jgi:hypothetical protein
VTISAALQQILIADRDYMRATGMAQNSGVLIDIATFDRLEYAITFL